MKTHSLRARPSGLDAFNRRQDESARNAAETRTLCGECGAPDQRVEQRCAFCGCLVEAPWAREVPNG